MKRGALVRANQKLQRDIQELKSFITIIIVQVCVANPPSELTSAGCAPVFPPGCNCDPEVFVFLFVVTFFVFILFYFLYFFCICSLYFCIAPVFPPRCNCDPEVYLFLPLYSCSFIFLYCVVFPPSCNCVNMVIIDKQ